MSGGRAVQRPLPGTPGRTRRSRPRANAEWETPSGLPHRWRTIIDDPAAQVLLDVTKFGNPTPWGRPQFNSRTGTTYLPERTRLAEDEWRVVMRAERRHPSPYPLAVGALLYFRVGDSRAGDVDNLAKLVLDAATGIIFDDDKQVIEAHIHVSRGHPTPGSDVLLWAKRPAPLPPPSP